MAFNKIVRKDLIIFLHHTKKQEALEELITRLQEIKPIQDAEKLRDSVFARETLMSTGIGLGIGMPHVRLESVREPIIAVGISKQGITDYVALDNQPVKIIIMILVGKDRHRQYIELVSRIIPVLKNEAVRNAILAAGSSDEVYELLLKAKAKP